MKKGKIGYIYYFNKSIELIAAIAAFAASNLLSLENERKTSFFFAFCSLIRNFACDNDKTKIL